mmetsp:Transcript_34027/g.70759  ORF Transcript_34027/g.70759 Transcript_34027/m.70759 type:complete len:204 (+) Transcript_34027:1437-2048(+)
MGCHLDGIAPLIDGNLSFLILLFELRRESPTAHNAGAASHHKSHPRIVRHESSSRHLSFIVQKMIMETSLPGSYFQIRVRVHFPTFHIAFAQGLLTTVIRSVGAKIIAILPDSSGNVTLNTHQMTTVEIGKDSLVGAHAIFHFQQDKVFSSFRIGNDSIGAPSTIRNEQTHSPLGGGKSTECLPRHDFSLSTLNKALMNLKDQ